MRHHASTGDDLSLTWIHSTTELIQMSDEWAALLERSQSDTIFLTPEWVLTWIEAYGGAHELCTLRIDCEGRLIGLALLSIRLRKMNSFLGRRSLCFAADGSGESEYLDLISERGAEEAVVNATLDACREVRRTWDVLCWNEIPAASPTVAHIRRWFRAHRWIVEETELPCGSVHLPPTWEEYVRALKPRMRSKVRALLRRLDTDHSIVFSCCNSEVEIPVHLRSLFALHGARWRLKGQDGVFGVTQRQAFYGRLSRRLFRRGWLRFFSLAIDGRFVAHQFCFERNGSLYLLQEGFNPAWARWGVGNMLRAAVLRDAMARSVSKYDFLGGETTHKNSWNAQTKMSLRIAAAPWGVRTVAYFLPRRLAQWGKEWGKRHSSAG